MEKLSSEQVKKLADDFMQMANALGDYRYENFDTLSKEENLKLKELHSKTLALTTEFYTQSAVLAFQEVESSLTQIDMITANTHNLYTKLTAVQKVIDHATSILGLASAIISLDAMGIADGIKKLLTPDVE